MILKLLLFALAALNPSAKSAAVSAPQLQVNWKQMPGGLKQVQHDGNVVCGVNFGDEIYCADQNIYDNPNWFKIPGLLIHVSVSQGRLYGVNSNHDIFYNPDYRTGNWIHIPGKLKQVDVDGKIVCGVNSADDIYCKDNLEGANWFQLPGKLIHVSVSNGRLYGTNANNDVFYNDNFRSGNWIYIPGSKLKQVDFNGNTVCGVNVQNNIFCKSDVSSANWVLFPGALDYISFSDKSLYGTNKGGEIWSTVKDPDIST